MDDFHARSRFARSTIPDEKGRTTRSLLLPPGRDAGPSQGYPQQYVAGTWVKRQSRVKLLV